MAERRDGTRRLYRLQPEQLGRVRAYLDAFWGDRLEALRERAEQEARGRRPGGRKLDRRS